MAKNSWLGWSPRLVGLIALALFALPMLATIWNMYQRADRILQQSIQRQLLSTARGITKEVDPALHGTFKSPEQENSDAYIEQIRRLERERLALDTDSIIEFVYTCIEQNGQIRFILDTTAPGDKDGDGKDDKAHIMEIYEQPSATLRSVLLTGVATVDQEPYQDRWGTFLSAYVPIFDDHHLIVGVVGVDMELTNFNLQRSSVRHLAIISAIGVLCLSYIGALGVAAYHRRLQRSVSELVATSEAAMTAARTKADFLASMSHELRTPLNAVIGMSELLRDTELDTKQQSFVGTIQRSGESLLNTLTDILDFSQLDAGSIEVDRIPVSLKRLLNEVQSHFQQDLQKKKLTLAIDIDPTCPKRFLGDADHMRQILRHLTMNAIKFTDSGHISIQVVLEKMEGEQEGLHFVIRDTGIGISPEQQEGLFMPFYQADGSTKRKYGGTGIGLAICKRLCDAMEGRIWAESEVGKGSAFHLVIPAPAVVSSRVGTVKTEALIWSQDMITQMLVSRVVEKQGLRVHVVHTFEELQSELAAHSVNWLLVDASVMTSKHVEEVKKLRGEAQVVVLNAEPGWMPDAGFDAVLTQPVRPADLRQVLES